MVGQSRFHTCASSRGFFLIVPRGSPSPWKSPDEAQNRRDIFLLVSAKFNPLRSHPAGIRLRAVSALGSREGNPPIQLQSQHFPSPVDRRGDNASLSRIRVTLCPRVVGPLFGNFVSLV